MARAINRLTARQVAALREPGLHADGAGLYLRIDQTGSRRWVYVFHLAGKRREMGLGSLADVTLAQARAERDEARDVIRRGGDPIVRRKIASAPDAPTFGALAGQVIADLAPSWRNPITARQWTYSLKTHAAPIWPMAVHDVDTDAVLAVLKPIWRSKHETATRVRARIERVLDVAKMRGLREGENPARWRGHLQLLLVSQGADAGHHAAMPYDDVPAFLTGLRAKESLAALLLEFTVLTAVRSSEAREARWSEIDETEKVWTIPKERMKSGREHRVPLSDAALAVLEKARIARIGDLIWPGFRRDKPLSNMVMAMQLRRAKLPYTVHGFRSSFRDWAGDCTSFPREVAEAALAHVVGNAVELAYRRSDALARRRQLMGAWADYCAGKSNVVAFPGHVAG